MNIFGIKNNVIEYTVNKADNKGIYISVQNGEVLVNAAWYVTSNQIQEVVEQKRKWILEKLNEYETTRKNIKKYIYFFTAYLLFFFFCLIFFIKTFALSQVSLLYPTNISGFLDAMVSNISLDASFLSILSLLSPSNKNTKDKIINSTPIHK